MNALKRFCINNTFTLNITNSLLYNIEYSVSLPSYCYILFYYVYMLLELVRYNAVSIYNIMYNKIFKYTKKNASKNLVKQLVAFSKHTAWMDDENTKKKEGKRKRRKAR